MGILELGAASNAISLAPHIDQLGFHRYWFTEHYSRGQSADPLATAAAVGAVIGPSELRLGSAGVLLPFTTPEAIVARCSVATSVRPRPFDLGVAFAATGDAALDRAMLGANPGPSAHDLEARLVRLRELVAQFDHVDEPGGEPWLLGPPSPEPVELWLCGSSGRSADIAARTGFNYAFHAGLAAATTDGPAVVEQYRSSFRSRWGHEPQVAVAAFASPGRPVEHLAISGDHAACAAGIERLAAAFGTGQIVLGLWSANPVVQLRGIRHISQTIVKIT